MKTTLNKGEVIVLAKNIWFNSWVEDGKKDQGTCCLGKGIILEGGVNWGGYTSVDIDSPPVQGNISAYQTSDAAMQFVKANGYPDAVYYDGVMD